MNKTFYRYAIFFFTAKIACYSSLEAMITTATEATIITVTKFGKSNNDNNKVQI